MTVLEQISLCRVSAGLLMGSQEALLVPHLSAGALGASQPRHPTSPCPTPSANGSGLPPPLCVFKPGGTAGPHLLRAEGPLASRAPGTAWSYVVHEDERRYGAPKGRSQKALLIHCQIGI